MAALAALPLLVIAGHSVAGAIAPASPPAPDGAFRVASFNIGYIRDPSGLPRWQRRRGAVTEVLKRIGADVIAFQEMETFAGGKFNRVNRQLDWILETVPGYAVAAFGDPETYPSTQPVLYRPDVFEAVDQGFFYYSDTPDVIYSRSFDGGFDYYASTATLRHRASGRLITFFNVHTDIRSPGNRLRAAEMIAERAAAMRAAGRAVIVLGDFNAHRGAPVLEIIRSAGLEGGRLLAPTFHLGIGLPFRLAIDHILHGPDLVMIHGPTIHRARPVGRYPSDHYPISAVFDLSGS
ncbi:endonuclease/exonuclease/phosphatase family protein [Oricola thermophila]|uniref:Endonuclease/exonuclease/phosphatase family protein n=1 Tax=Oricola thermophila TaxID=2742145 RepID=A0A6N1VLY5_9HYPH|nr:endonuclease/exonuclease/phosphatase family protein [Oricola thermophila]QKV19967.1 endonuclease/exonuclease/phosphatase family protein [Oricola thermophila]